MNVLLIAQCDKRALTETRRILDQFAERRGERTWQTPITQAGLDTVRRLLRKTARKNTAVACHWIRGMDHSELLWIVGDARRFNTDGAVPTNTTTRNVLRREDENDWHTAEDIRLLAQMAALMHDLGKASVAFQARLRGKLRGLNLYRHEWVSLRMFLAFVGTDDDATWLARLADRTVTDASVWTAVGRYQRDGLDEQSAYPFRDLPPIAAAVAWLIVTHHRLPVVPVFDEHGAQRGLGCRSTDPNPLWLEDPLHVVAHHWNEARQQASAEQIAAYWTPAAPLPVTMPGWKAQVARLASRLLQRRATRADDWLSNPYVMHLARLSLMLADHYYSALPAAAVSPGQATKLYANTDRDGRLKQTLEEHLLGVTRDTGLIAHALPGFDRHLPRLANHRGLRKRSADARFTWQDKAADAATAMRENARENGAFIVNMASTGCGKTLGNARILYALADAQTGMRATYALGLRTLTLQTGRSYRDDLHLGDDELAVQVGGSASRSLFEFYAEQAEASGSGSIQSLIEEDSHVLYEGTTADHPLLSRAMQDESIRKLLSAPLLVCTVDHLVPATEATRAGRQIAPMLRLMSGDLILDELDDYGLDDLPALTRLVHWAGLLGARVVLSSATLPPALLEGMFMAYHAGRVHYRSNCGAQGEHDARAVEVPCLWVDEFGVQQAGSADASAFRAQHMQFVAQRAADLTQAQAVPLRRGELLPLKIAKNASAAEVHAVFAKHLQDASMQLHAAHAEPDPVSGKRVSFGLVRMANIDPLFNVACEWFALGATEDTHIHLCVYHARFPLVQRSAIEHMLDTTFDRRGDGKGVYRLPHIRAAIDASPASNHVFIVLASPVCEVGRDWDADWAIAEPSSMRSLIQLAGRVQRHRRRPGKAPNVLICDTNLRNFRKRAVGDPPAIFIRPGFEMEGAPLNSPFRLLANKLGKLLVKDEYQSLTAIPRIRPRPPEQMQPKRNLVDLEHARVADCMLPRPDTSSRPSAASIWQFPRASLTGVLAQQLPFRDETAKTVDLAFLPEDGDEDRLSMCRVEDARNQRGKKLYVLVDESLCHEQVLTLGPGISGWGDFDLAELVAEQADFLDLSFARCAQKMATVTVPASEQKGWRYHPWLGLVKKE